MALFILVLHFGLILVLANPFAVKMGKLDYYAQWYAYPYFSQNWNLFVPPPSTNYKLFVEYEDNGIQRKDIFTEILNEHQANRFKGYGPLLLAIGNSIHYFEKNTALQNALNGPIKDDLYFKIVEKAAQGYLRSAKDLKIEKLKMILLVEKVNSDSSRVYFN